MNRAAFMGADPQKWLEQFRFSFPLRIRYSETDMLGHVNNVSYFMYFEQGRIEYFDHLGLDELFDEQAYTVVADQECQYLLPIYLKDKLKLHVRTVNIGRSSMDIHYALTVQGELRAAGRSTAVLIDTASGRSTPIPEHARRAIFELEGLEHQE